MIGSNLLKYFSKNHDVVGTLRQSKDKYSLDEFDNLVPNVDAKNFEVVKDIIVKVNPDVVINCIGIVKQISARLPASDQIYLNALLPHLLSDLSTLIGFRSVSLSSDCVFSGSRGNYKEVDEPDATDIYGLTKALGEVKDQSGLTIRTSTIGLELEHRHGLIEWFLSQKGEIEGYDRAIYTGLTTTELAKYLEHILLKYPKISGVVQIAGAKITKFDMLRRLARAIGRIDIQIKKNIDFECDRSLIGEKLQKLTGYDVPDWDYMINDLARQIIAREAGI